MDSSTSSSVTEDSLKAGRRLPNGEMLFTGPDGVGDHRMTVGGDQLYIGEKAASPWATNDVRYVIRAPEVRS
jgi:hypothetical protein